MRTRAADDKRWFSGSHLPRIVVLMIVGFCIAAVAFTEEFTHRITPLDRRQLSTAVQVQTGVQNGAANQPSSLAGSSHANDLRLDRLLFELRRTDRKMEDAFGCAAANCHGGPRPGIPDSGAERGSEFTIWKTNDPHSRGWHTLCSATSTRILQRLKILEQGIVVDAEGFRNCLACHATVRHVAEKEESDSAPASVLSSFDATQGIQCAGCHGPSESWKTTHYRLGFVPNGDGFHDNSDLTARARNCASCHVGDSDRDMNHDIIAAGHPRLQFEFLSFHRRYPKHWRDATSSRSELDARLWLAGQVASADAWLALLEARAAGTSSEKVWPEFAGYDCASCHRAFKLIDVRKGLQRDQKRLDPTTGRAAVSRWHGTGLTWWLRHEETADLQRIELADALDSIRRQMDAAGTRDDIAGAAAEARHRLAIWYDTEGQEIINNHRGTIELPKLIDWTAKRDDTFSNWGSSAQYFLLTTATRAAWPTDDPSLNQLVRRMQYGLRFPEGKNISRFHAIQRSQSNMIGSDDMRKLAQEFARRLKEASRK